MKVKIQVIIESEGSEKTIRVFLHIPPKRYIPGISGELLTHIGHFCEIQREK